MSTHQDTMTPFQPLYTPGPTFYSPVLGSWQVPNYKDVVNVLALQTSGAVGREGGYPPEYEAMSPALRAMWLRDEPAHGHLRAMVDQYFRPKALAPLLPALAAKAHKLLHERASVGRIEIVEEYVVPLTRYAVCDLLLGIDPSQEQWLCTWQDAQPTALLLDERNFVPAFEAWLERGAPRPGSLLERLIDLYHQGAPIGDAPMNLSDLVAFFAMFAIGAYASLRTQCALVLATLIEHQVPETLRERRDDVQFPALLSSAREEALRHRTSFPLLCVVTRSVVRLGGQEIPPGTILNLWLSAASRDPAVYTQPDRFDLFRYVDRGSPKPPLLFGYGMHYCLGAHLSRGLIDAALIAFIDLVPSPVRLAEVTFYPYYGVDHAIKQALVLYGKEM